MADCPLRGICNLGRELGVQVGNPGASECSGSVKHFRGNPGGAHLYQVCAEHLGQFLYWYRNCVEVDESGAPIAGGVVGMYASGAAPLRG